MILGVEIYKIIKTRTLGSQVGSLETEHCRVDTSLW